MESYLESRANLDGRRGAVVGGAGGLGRACALDLARAGVDLAIFDCDRRSLEETSRAAEEAGVRSVHVEGDARDADALDWYFETVADEFEGALDVLVNVVGGTFRQSFADSNPRGWQALVHANFTWLLAATHRAIPLLRANGGGSIVNLTSIEAHRAAPGFAVYAAMKAAVTSFTRTIAVELGPEQIRVNCVAPDIVPTAGLGGVPGGDPSAGPSLAISEDQARIGVPMGRLGTEEDVGGCVLFLASDLSRYVTGTTLHPDGGTIASSGWLNWPGTGFSNLPPIGFDPGSGRPPGE